MAVVHARGDHGKQIVDGLADHQPVRERLHLLEIAVKLRDGHHARERGKMIVFFRVGALHSREVEREQIEMALQRAEEILRDRGKADRVLSGVFVFV